MPVVLREGVNEGVIVGVWVCVPVIVAETEGVIVPEVDGVGETVLVLLGEPVPVALCVGDVVVVAVVLGLPLGVGVVLGLPVSVCEGERLGVPLPVKDGVGEGVGDSVPVLLGEPD